MSPSLFGGAPVAAKWAFLGLFLRPSRWFEKEEKRWGEKASLLIDDVRIVWSPRKEETRAESPAETRCTDGEVETSARDKPV